MSSHRFDPVALVFGLVFAAAGIIVLAGGDLLDEGRVLAPVGLVGLGVALLVRTAVRPRPRDPADPAGSSGREPAEPAEPAEPVTDVTETW